MIADVLIRDRVRPENVNNWTIAALDPMAKIPEYKVSAVRLDPL